MVVHFFTPSVHGPVPSENQQIDLIVDVDNRSSHYRPQEDIIQINSLKNEIVV